MTQNPRRAGYPIEPRFTERWSPRAFSQETISPDALMTIFEAARWSPSAYNSQPWHFVYAYRGTPEFEKLLSCLIEFNQGWAKHAAALVFVVSNTMMRAPGAAADVPSRSHSFDAGAAWGALAMQATHMGWYTHGMTGVNFELAQTELAVPSGYFVEAAIAIGRLGDKSQLPEMLQGREMPSDRKPLAAIVSEGAFKV